MTEYEAFVMATSPNGKVGDNAIVPRVVESFAMKDNWILDFGCGKHRKHVRDLKKKGYYKTFGYDFHHPGSEKYIDLKYFKYDIIMLSNVLNVQPYKSDVNKVLSTVSGLVRDGGVIVANYPSSPRKAGLTLHQMKEILKNRFKTVIRVHESLAGKNVVFQIYNEYK